MSLTYSKSNLVDFSSVLGQHLGVKVWRKHTYCSKRKNCFMSKSYQKPISGNLQQDKSWNAEHYRKSYSFVGKLGAPVLELLQPLKGKSALQRLLSGCKISLLTRRKNSGPWVWGRVLIKGAGTCWLFSCWGRFIT